MSKELNIKSTFFDQNLKDSDPELYSTIIEELDRQKKLSESRRDY